MEGKTDRRDSLRKIRCLVETVAEATSREMVFLRKQREVYFTPSLRRILSIDPVFVDVYDQMMRDKRAVIRRCILFSAKLNGYLARASLTEQDCANIVAESGSICAHSRAVTECCEEINAELKSLDAKIDSTAQLLDGFGGDGLATDAEISDQEVDDDLNPFDK